MSNVYDLSQFRKEKAIQQALDPIFKEPTILTLGDPADESTQIQYNVMMSLTFDEKQFLVLEEFNSQEREISIVEAIVNDNEFQGVQYVSNEDTYNKVSELVTAIAQQASSESSGECNIETGTIQRVVHFKARNFDPQSQELTEADSGDPNE